MRRFVSRSLALLALTVFAVPPIVAAVAKFRGDRPTVADFDPTADEIDLGVIFEGFDLRSEATAFRGGDLLLCYGGGSLDMRGATLDPAGGRLRVRSMFGGLQLIVPESWPVRVHSMGIFGGAGNEATPADETEAALEIEALSVFGGIGIVTRDPRSAA